MLDWYKALEVRRAVCDKILTKLGERRQRSEQDLVYRLNVRRTNIDDLMRKSKKQHQVSPSPLLPRPPPSPYPCRPLSVDGAACPW